MNLRRGIFTILVLSLWLTASASAAHPFKQVYQLQFEGKLYFWVGVRADGEVVKAYPKPQTIIGRLKDKGAFESVPATADNYFPMVANVVALRDLDENAMKSVRRLLFESIRLQIPDGDKTKESSSKVSAAQPLPIDISKIKLVPVSDEELKKIAAIERALLGTWKFTQGTSYFGTFESKLETPEKPLPFKSAVKFCDDRECLLDGDVKKFYWIDGRFLRLSFQGDLKPESYSQAEEFDVIQITETELVIRSMGVPFPPSVEKERGNYPKFQLFKEFRFKKMRPKSD